jgi:hypothetical protein
LCGQYGTSLRNYPVQNRVERGLLPACGVVYMHQRPYILYIEL